MQCNRASCCPAIHKWQWPPAVVYKVGWGRPACAEPVKPFCSPSLSLAKGWASLGWRFWKKQVHGKCWAGTHTEKGSHWECRHRGARTGVERQARNPWFMKPFRIKAVFISLFLIITVSSWILINTLNKYLFKANTLARRLLVSVAPPATPWTTQPPFCACPTPVVPVLYIKLQEDSISSGLTLSLYTFVRFYRNMMIKMAKSPKRASETMATASQDDTSLAQ